MQDKSLGHRNIRRYASYMVIVMASLYTPNVWAAPFGLAMGMSLKELSAYAPKPVKKQTNVYRIETAPRHSSNFDHYLLRIDPQHGLCVINAVSKDMLVTPTGETVRQSYANLKTQLTDKYGEPALDIDQIVAGSLWAAPQQWMRSLFFRERSLTSIWSSQTTPLVGNIADIALTARAKTISVANLSLTYEYTNLGNCELTEQRANLAAL